MIILHSKAGLESATALYEALKASGIKVAIENPYDTGNRDYTKHKVIFKYGFSRPIKYKKEAKVFNNTEPTLIALDKLKTLNSLKEFNISVPYTTKIKEASKWLKEAGVVARATATGHNSEGITFCDTAEELINAEAVFYTKYLEYTNEFRINVWRNKVVSVYEKQNHGGTFKFVLFKGVEDHPQLKHIVGCVYNSIGLDWYGIDVLRDNKGNLTLLEVNSAPVLYPYTLNKLSAIIAKEVQ